MVEQIYLSKHKTNAQQYWTLIIIQTFFAPLNPIYTGLFKPAAYRGGAESVWHPDITSEHCVVSVWNLFSLIIFSLLLLPKFFFSKIERCVNPRPAVMTVSRGLFFFFFSTPLNLRSERDKKRLKVRKHGIPVADVSNMADIEIWCSAESAPPRYK